jgi:hypothetical protein
LYVQKIGLFHFVGSDDFFLHLRIFVVCGAGPRAGDFHGDLGSLHLLLRNLLQAGHIAGEKKLISINLLLWGSFVFVMLLVGLAFTVIEFRNMK